jgi:tetratricopeptide (TPR) repeat protein
MLTNSLGKLFSYKKEYDIALNYYNKSIRMADSLKFTTLKIPGYLSILNYYLEKSEPDKALTYLNSAEGKSLKSYLLNFGYASQIDLAYGIVYRELGRYDSAKYYLEKAAPDIEKNLNSGGNLNTLYQMAAYYKLSGDKVKAIQYYLRVKDLAEKTGVLEYIRRSAKNLDTLYAATGNMQLSGMYKGIYYTYKDSIDKLGKEKELANIEAKDEQQRQLKLENEKKEQKKRRNNIQYMGITIGIIMLFVALVVLGMFKVSRGLIKALGFFGFLLLFEFIFLIFKKKIYEYTQGEPWRDLLFMIGLAALLVPLHHWLEHKVLNYLTSHNRLTSAGLHIKKRLFGTTKDEHL